MTDLWDPVKRDQTLRLLPHRQRRTDRARSSPTTCTPRATRRCRASRPPCSATRCPGTGSTSARRPSAVQKDQGYDGKTARADAVAARRGRRQPGRVAAADRRAGEESQKDRRRPRTGDVRLLLVPPRDPLPELAADASRAVEKPGRVPMRTWPSNWCAWRPAPGGGRGGGQGRLGQARRPHRRPPEGVHREATRRRGRDRRGGERASRRGPTASPRSSRRPAVDDGGDEEAPGPPAEMFAKETLDFDSARQVAWGYEVLSQDLGEGKEKPGPDLRISRSTSTCASRRDG